MVFLCQSPSLFAQRNDMLLVNSKQVKNDSLLKIIKKDSLLSTQGVDSTFKTKYIFPKSWTINWDARSSFLDSKPVNIWGVNVAMVHGEKRHQVTLGYYWLTYNSLLRLINLSKGASKLINLDYYTKTDLYFYSLMYRWNFINNKKFLFGMPFEIGMGATTNTASTVKSNFFLWERDDFFMPVQAGVYFEWRATRWVGLAVQGGYRYAMIQNNIKDNYNSIYYSYGISFHSEILIDTYNWLFKRKSTKSQK